MFSSTSLIPFLPHLISSFSSNSSPLVTDTNRFSFPPKNSTNDVLLFDSLNSMVPPPPPPSHAMGTNYVDQHNPSATSSSFLNQSRKTGSKPVKKDRHSKIFTAQGLRDRRVRLSIGIARKFFDLQDMLGFEKASETLEWLLNKSKKAIQEVHEVSRNENNGNCITTIATSSTCELVSQIRDVFPKRDDQKNSRRSSSLKVSVHIAKESRAKARARARERTRVKMYTKKGPRSDVLDQNNQTCEKSKLATYEHQLEVPNKGTSVTEESSFMVIKKKLKPNNGIVGTYHQNHVMWKDVSCINSSNLMNLPQNWDFSSATANSGFCAITNINPSTGLHLCRKLWDAEGNYCPN